MEQADTLLFKQWQNQGDADAFSEIVRRHWSMVFGCCRRMLKDSAQAEEVAQECFVELMRSRARVRVSLAAWLHKISVRRSQDRIRGESRRRAREKAFAADTANAVSDHDPALNELIARVDEAMAQLPKELHGVLVARYLEAISYVEIGARLGLSESSARLRVNRAVEEVRRSLKRLGVMTGTAAIVAAITTPAAAIPVPAMAKLAKLAVAGPAPMGTVAALFAVSALKLAILLLVVALGGTAAWVALKPPARDIAPTLQAKVETPASADAGPRLAAAPEGDVPSSEQQPAPAAAPLRDSGQRDYSISGRVYDAATGTGIQGVQIVVFSAANSTINFGNDILTHSDGAFYVDKLPDGEYRVVLQEVAGYPESSVTRHASVVNLRDGGQADGIDFAIEKGVCVIGRVVDLEGKGVPEAEVALRASLKTNNIKTVSDPEGFFTLYAEAGLNDVIAQARTETHRSNLYTLGLLDSDIKALEIVLDQKRAGLIAGSVVNAERQGLPGYDVRAWHVRHDVFLDEQAAKTDSNGRFILDHCGSGEYSIIIVPPAADGRFSSSEEYARVTLEAGERVEGLEIVYGEKGGLAIAGQALDVDGKPVGGALITIHHDTELETAHTDEAGSFRITGLTDKEYSLSFEHPQYLKAKATLRAGTLDALIELTPPASVLGTVVQADTGKPVRNFMIAINGGPTQSALNVPWARPRMFSDDEGRFTLDEMRDSDINVTVWAKGLAPGTQHVEFEEGKDAVLKFALHPARPVHGVVVDGQGAPVPGAAIYVAQRLNQWDIESHTAAKSDENGEFMLESLPSEASSIYAYAPGHAVGVALVTDNVKIVLPATASVEGHIEGVEGDRVSVHGFYTEDWGIPHLSAIPDAQGLFRLSDVAPGSLLVSVVTFSQQQQTTARRVQVTPGAELVLDFVLPKGATSVTGRITKGGQPLKGTRVAIQKQSDDLILEIAVPTDQTGSFTFNNVWAGKAQLIIYDGESLPVTCEIDVPDEGAMNQEIELDA